MFKVIGVLALFFGLLYAGLYVFASIGLIPSLLLIIIYEMSQKNSK